MHAPDAHVLVVDDHRNVRETVTAALETNGYHVRCADNGAQALAALLHERRPEAVILDLSMPIMTGWELIATVHEDRDLAGDPPRRRLRDAGPRGRRAPRQAGESARPFDDARPPLPPLIEPGPSHGCLFCVAFGMPCPRSGPARTKPIAWRTGAISGRDTISASARGARRSTSRRPSPGRRPRASWPSSYDGPVVRASRWCPSARAAASAVASCPRRAP